MNIFKKKSLKSITDKTNKMALVRNFSTLDLIFLGMGSVIGSGVFSATGIVVGQYSGSAVIISYLIAGLCSIFISLIYAELSSMIPVSGSLYSYTFVILGEVVAFVVLAIVFLEIGFAASFVASACSEYFHKILEQLNIDFPLVLKNSTEGSFDLIASLIILVLGYILYLGNVISKGLNVVLVCVKMSTIFIFIFISAQYFDIKIWVENFNPFGVNKIFVGSAVLFLAFNGYSNLASTAEECKNPNKSIAIALIVSMSTAIIVYSVLSLVLTGMADFRILNSIGSLAIALKHNGNNWGAGLIATGAMCGMITVTLINIFTVSRVLYSASKDGVLFKLFSKIHSKYNTPSTSILFTTVILSLVAGLLNPRLLVNVSTFAMLYNGLLVVLLVIIARFTYKEAKRPFKAPLLYVTSVIAVSLIMYLLLEQIVNKFSMQAKIVIFSTLFMTILYFVVQFFKSNTQKIRRINTKKSINS